MNSRYGFGKLTPRPVAPQNKPTAFRCAGCERICCLGCGARCKTEEAIDPVPNRYCAFPACVLLEAQASGLLSEHVERLHEKRKTPCEHSSTDC